MRTADPPAEPSLEPGRARTKTDSHLLSETPATVPEPTLSPEDAQLDKGSTPVDAESISVTPTYPSHSAPAVSYSPPDMLQSTSASTPQTTEATPSVTVRSPPPAPSSQAAPVISLGSQALIPPPPAGVSGGESIYMTIMNRIAMLEHNATLRARYVEEHTVGVREVLKRLTEEVGRLEGIVS